MHWITLRKGMVSSSGVWAKIFSDHHEGGHQQYTFVPSLCKFQTPLTLNSISTSWKWKINYQLFGSSFTNYPWMNLWKRMSPAALFTYFKYCGQEVRVCSAFISYIKGDLQLTSLWGWEGSHHLPGAWLLCPTCYCRWSHSRVYAVTLIQIPSPASGHNPVLPERMTNNPLLLQNLLPLRKGPGAMPELGESRGAVSCFLCSLWVAT